MWSIIDKKILGPGIKEIHINAKEIAGKAKAGQFVVLRIDERGERIPLTLADWDVSTGTITLIFQEVGKTTIKLGLLNIGDNILDLIGPMGHPTQIEKFGKVVGIGGGAGIASLFPVMREMKKIGNKTISIIGAKSKEHLFWENEISAVSDRLIMTTDDGSYGKRGFVSDALKSEIDNTGKFDLVFVVGPAIMMKVISDITRTYGIKTIASINSIMIDATGMCGGCRVDVGGKKMFACVDGPEFNAHDVDFDLLLSRQKSYLKEEEVARHNCMMSQ